MYSMALRTYFYLGRYGNLGICLKQISRIPARLDAFVLASARARVDLSPVISRVVST